MTAPMLSLPGCGATVLRAHGRRLCKLVRPDGEMVPYDAARTFDFHPSPLAELADLHALLLALAGRSDCALVRGEPADAGRLRSVRRLQHADPATGEAATLRDVPRRWVALDLDGLPLPAGADPRDMAACARAVLPRLPTAFQRVACAVQATASHGIKPGARLRLWHWLSRPTTSDELAVWLSAAPVDRSVFRTAQPIYTAAPIFAAGAADPVPCRLLLLPGECQAVPVPSAATLMQVRRLPPPRRDDGDAGTDRRLAALVRFFGAASAGERSDRLYWAARRVGEMVGRGELGRAEAVRRLAAEAVHTGLTEREALATAESGIRTGAGETVHG